jgi:hypothetical protein
MEIKIADPRLLKHRDAGKLNGEKATPCSEIAERRFADAANDQS